MTAKDLLNAFLVVVGAIFIFFVVIFLIVISPALILAYLFGLCIRGVVDNLR